MIELMVVVAIVALMVTMGVGGFNRSRQRQELIKQGVFIESMLKDARNASVIGLRGLDETNTDVPPGFGVNINLADGADDDDVITYFTDEDQDYVFTAPSDPPDEGEDFVVDTITLEAARDVHITDILVDGTSDNTIDELNIVFVPPRGLSLITTGSGAGTTIINDLQIVLGIEGETSIDDNLAIPINVTTGGGMIDLIIY